jgi:hypothetical protein
LNTSNKPAIYLALLHHPVYNKNREIVATAVTNIDVHDIARSSRTYGLAGVFYVTPIESQQVLVSEILKHWTTGPGAKYNPVRAEAFANARVIASLELASQAVQEQENGQKPQWVATSAQADGQVSTYESYREQLTAGELPPQLLLFGTGWGITQEVLQRANIRLAPIKRAGEGAGQSGYNHLSVRSAVAIVLDRLLGNRAE